MNKLSNGSIGNLIIDLFVDVTCNNNSLMGQQTDLLCMLSFLRNKPRTAFYPKFFFIAMVAIFLAKMSMKH